MKPNKKIQKTKADNTGLKIAAGAFLFLLFIALILTPVYQGKKPAPAIKRKPRPAPVKVEKAAGLIAIVLDDWGYRLDNLDTVRQIKQPLTCAILPNLEYSAQVMAELNKTGKEIMLHLPMEPKEKINLEQNTITLGMNAGQVKRILDRDLENVSLAKGVNNHMGSRVTEDVRSGGLVLAQIKARNLFFLDSFVTGQSVMGTLAKKMKIRYAKRDIFLDNEDDPRYIRGQLIKLKNLAKIHGQAIGIGHDRKNTVAVLKEMLPEMEKEGYRFVFVSRLAH